MHTSLRTTLLILAALAVVGAGAYVLFAQKALSPTVPAKQGEDRMEAKTYMSMKYGFSFEYPGDYVLTEREVSDDHPGHYQIMLVAESDPIAPEGGEGPISVSIDLYQNDTDRQSVMGWITGTSIANYKLGDERIEESKVAGAAAYTNTWSGLYEGKTTTFARGDDIIAISVTWMSPQDKTIAAYEQVLESFRFSGSGAVQAQ